MQYEVIGDDIYNSYAFGGRICGFCGSVCLANSGHGVSGQGAGVSCVLSL